MTGWPPPHHPPCRAGAPPPSATPRLLPTACSLSWGRKKTGGKKYQCRGWKGWWGGGSYQIGCSLEEADLGKICLPVWCCCVTWCSRPKLNMTWTQPLGKHAGLIPVFSSNEFFMRCLSDCLTNWREGAGLSLCHTDQTDLEWRLYI